MSDENMQLRDKHSETQQRGWYHEPSTFGCLCFLTRKGFSAYTLEFLIIAVEPARFPLAHEASGGLLREVKIGDYCEMLDEFDSGFNEGIIGYDDVLRPFTAGNRAVPTLELIERHLSNGEKVSEWIVAP